MDILIIAAQLILSLSILIVLHELGHFIPAKLFKTKVEKFYLFFNPWFSLFKVKKGETEYGIGWLPLGGYVKIAGMIDESMDTDQMKGEPEPWEFRSKPAWQRLIIMIGGITVNIIVGILIYSLVSWGWGEKYVAPTDVSYGYAIHPVMEKYGLKDGDIVTTVDGEKLEDASSIGRHLLFRSPEKLTVVGENGGERTIELPDDIGSILWAEGIEQNAISFRTKSSPIDSVVQKTSTGEETQAYKQGLKKGDVIYKINDEKIDWHNQIGHQMYSSLKSKNYNIPIEVIRGTDTLKKTITLDTNSLTIGFIVKGDTTAIKKISSKSYGFFASFPHGFSKAYYTLHDYVVQFKYVFTLKGAKQIGGFGSMAKLFSSTWNWERFWLNTALISIILAFMNFLPIPALDGGYIMFLLFEIITGKQPSDKFMEKANTIGFFLLIALLLYANLNDTGIFK